MIRFGRVQVFGGSRTDLNEPLVLHDLLGNTDALLFQAGAFHGHHLRQELVLQSSLRHRKVDESHFGAHLSVMRHKTSRNNRLEKRQTAKKPGTTSGEYAGLDNLVVK